MFYCSNEVRTLKLISKNSLIVLGSEASNNKTISWNYIRRSDCAISPLPELVIRLAFFRWHNGERYGA